MVDSISKKDIKKLWGRSHNRCALPECRRKLIVDKTASDAEAVIGEMAHIKGEKPDASRYDLTQSDNERNGYDNRILVCGGCHTLIDKQPKTYTVDKLHEIKHNHEKWADSKLEEELMNVTFAELNVVTKYLMIGTTNVSTDLSLISPDEKIRKNGLSTQTAHLITMGMLQVKQVTDYISRSPDPEFGERLKQGFINEYIRLKDKEHLSGDDIFDALLMFASGGNNDFKVKAAGLSVLVYLFEKCEVFEK